LLILFLTLVLRFLSAQQKARQHWSPAGLVSFDLSGRLLQAMAVRRHECPMIMVVAVMAVVLHLIQTLSANTARCQMFLLQRAGMERRIGVVQSRSLRSIGALALLCLSLGAVAQNQHRDSTGAPKTSMTAPPPEQRVDINHASLAELLQVPGLPRGWAERIVRFRPYRSKQDLFDKGVLSSGVYDRIKDFVIAHHDKE
jgi:competence protein ComEA